MSQPVTLTDMLDARERRAFRQQQLTEQYHAAVVCFTMNIAGPIKNSPLIREGFEIGKRLLTNRMLAQKIKCIHFEEIHEHTGNEAFFVIHQNPLTVKQITCEIEDESELGRLFDMDVIREDGKKVDRSELGLLPRTCIICGEPAKGCARNRTHTVEELQRHTDGILKEAITDYDAKQAAGLACRALLYEVATTPKPGLVDRRNSGSHKDMDIFTFMNSAGALCPYFDTCVRIGKTSSDQPAPHTFSLLRRAGKKAEADMFFVTGGVNTHKGAIFSVGVLCAALGRLPKQQWKNVDAVLFECAAMTAGLVASDFKGLTEENADTVGKKLYLHHGISGVRGQMEAGLPAVRNHGLPVLKEGIARGLSINASGCAALLSIMVSATDTNLIARSSVEKQQEVVKKVKVLLKESPYPDEQTLERLDREFIAENLSPGGSADLLAICYFLYFLESEV